MCQYEVRIDASQSWKKGSTGRYSIVDVSDGESFLWVGKTTYKLKNFKPNVSKQYKTKSAKMVFPIGLDFDAFFRGTSFIIK